MSLEKGASSNLNCTLYCKYYGLNLANIHEWIPPDLVITFHCYILDSSGVPKDRQGSLLYQS